MNEALKGGLPEKRSACSIVHSSKIDTLVPTMYRHIKERKADVARMDLPYAAIYKREGSEIKSTNTPEKSKIDRHNRTYIGCLAYRKSHINEMTAQMDFLRSIVSGRCSILVAIIPETHFPFLLIIEDRDSEKVVGLFNGLERPG